MNQENLVIHKLFSRTAAQYPDKTALQIRVGGVFQGYTYREIEEYRLRVAAFLIKHELKKSDAVALILENCPEWGMIYLGIVSCGCICVPLDPQLSKEEIKNLLIHSEARLVFCSAGIYGEKLKEAISDYPIKCVVLEQTDIKGISAGGLTLPEVLPDDTASLIYTSGTTGLPKGVLLSHKNICSNFISIRKLNICNSDDNALAILPLYHSYAFMVTLITPLFLGAKVTYCQSFKPHELGQIIKQAKVTILPGVPQLFSLLHGAVFEKINKAPFLLRFLIRSFARLKIKQQLGSLRIMVSGGARLQPQIGRDLSGLGLKITEGYGLTETSPVVTMNPLGKMKFGSVGKPIPDVEIKISDPDKSITGSTSMSSLSRPERREATSGQVIIKGPNVMKGYFKQPDLTNQVIKEGWFYSGDLGYIDKEGYLFLTGRQGEVIVLGSGKNIYPEELEEHYRQSRHIKEICILTKSEKSFGKSRESLFAVIVPDLEFFKQNKEANLYEKIRWDIQTLSRNIPSYKHIMGFILTKEELPKTALKKIKRFEVRQKYLGAKPEAKIREIILSKEDAEILNSEVGRRITVYITKELNKPVYLDSHLEIDLGIDSLTRVELGLGLEALFKVKVPDEMLYAVSTVKDVILSVQGIIGSAGTLKEVGEKQKTWEQILKELPPDDVLGGIKLKFGFPEILATWLVKNIFLFIYRVFWFLRIKGIENLPEHGPYLICPNHASYLDGPFVFHSLPFRKAMMTYFLGYSHIFGSPFISWGAKTARLISIDTATHLTEAMQAVSYVAANKKIICIFPEGMRSIDERVADFKKGVGILIKELNIPVVPVYIKGSHKSWPRGTRFPRPYPVKVIFGKPLTRDELLKKAGEKETGIDDYTLIARALREEVLKLKC